MRVQAGVLRPLLSTRVLRPETIASGRKRPREGYIVLKHTQTGGTRAGRTWPRAAITTAVAVVAAAASAGPAQANLGAFGPSSFPNGKEYPSWYSDSNGLQLQPCIDGSANCAAVTAGDLQPPDGEAFYWLAQSGDIALPNGGTVSGTFGVELAFGGSKGDTPITFSRVRYTFSKDAPAGSYDFVTPWGPDSVEHAAGHKNDGVDTGCAPVLATDVCDYDIARNTLITSFLSQAAGAPAGYIGDAATLGPVVGSPTQNNTLSVGGAGGAGSTSDFTVTGKLADTAAPVPVLSATPVAFGDQTTGTAGAVKPVTVRNDGIVGASSGLTIGTPSIGGANAGDFAIASDGCAGTTVAAGSSCTIGVRFTPGADGGRSATLTIPSNAATSPDTVALGGNGVTPPAITGGGVGAGGGGGGGGGATPGAVQIIDRTIIQVVPGAGAAAAPSASGAALQAAQAGGVAVKDAVVRSLALNSLTLSQRISRARLRSQGLRIGMGLPLGTQVVRVAVYRAKSDGSRTGAALFAGYRLPSRSGPFHVTLRDSALIRRLRRGRYAVEVRPGQSRASLGLPSRARFRVVR
jgi:hypothetical protein